MWYNFSNNLHHCQYQCGTILVLICIGIVPKFSLHKHQHSCSLHFQMTAPKVFNFILPCKNVSKYSIKSSTGIHNSLQFYIFNAKCHM